MTTRRSVNAAALAAALALTACGGSVLKGFPEEPLPSTPEGSLAALDQAEGRLRLALGEPPSTAQGAQLQPSATSPAGQPAPSVSPAPPMPPTTDAQKSASPSQVEAADAAPGAAESSPSSGDPCSNACRALASMMRATEHLCSLAGAADARCEGARARVKSAGERVRSHCPSCSAG